MCIVNEDHPQCNVSRKAIKACQSKGRGAVLWREWPRLPFSPQDFCRPCVFVYCCHHTGSCWPGSASGSQPGYELGKAVSGGEDSVYLEAWRLGGQGVNCTAAVERAEVGMSLFYSTSRSHRHGFFLLKFGVGL